MTLRLIAAIFTIIILLAVFFISFSPLGGLAVISLPKALFLTKENPRYFNLSLGILIKDKKFHVNYPWRCTQKRAFSAATGWRLIWKTDSGLVAKKLKKDLTVYFYVPNHCFKNTRKFTPTIFIGNGQRPPIITWVYNWDQETKSKFNIEINAYGKIEETEKLISDNLMTIDEKRKSIWLSKNRKKYVSRSVQVIPKYAWSSNETLKSIFKPIETSITAKELLTRNNPKARVFGFESSRSSSTIKDSYEFKNYRQILKDGNITINLTKPIKNRFDYHYEENIDKNSIINFCYLDECFDIKDGFNEIFYAPKQELLIVSKSGLQL